MARYLAVVSWLGLACAGPTATARVAVQATEAPLQVELCKTSSADLERAYGKPYRDGWLHRFRIQAFMMPYKHADKEVFLAVLIGEDGLVHDLAFDLPGIVDWRPEDQCPNQLGKTTP